VPAPPPPLPEEEEEEDPTQFYTGTDGFHLFRADEYHCLEVNDGDKLAARYVVSPLGIKIGRTAPADVILADSRVSRAHCTVELAGKQLKVSDLKSTNGTFVDGERIVEPTLLEVGSVLRVGNVSFVHEIRTAADV
jgi:predicted component of type VI protein secretion system